MSELKPLAFGFATGLLFTMTLWLGSIQQTLEDIRTLQSEARDANWCLYDLQATGYQPDVCIDRP